MPIGHVESSVRAQEFGTHVSGNKGRTSLSDVDSQHRSLLLEFCEIVGSFASHMGRKGVWLDKPRKKQTTGKLIFFWRKQLPTGYVASELAVHTLSVELRACRTKVPSGS